MKTLLQNLLERLLSYTTIIGLALGAFVWRSVLQHGWAEGSVWLALLSVALLLVHDRELLKFLVTLWQSMRQPPSPPLVIAAGLGLVLGSGCRSLPQRCAELYPPIEVLRRDTLIVRPEARTDTLTRVLRLYDTLRIDTGRVRLYVLRQRDTLTVAASCPADSVRLQIVERTRTIDLPTPWYLTWWAGVLYAVGAIAGAAALNYFLGRVQGWYNQQGPRHAERLTDAIDRRRR